MHRDVSDTVIQRRVLQKHGLIAGEEAQAVIPADAELADWVRQRADIFRQPPLVSSRPQVLRERVNARRSDARAARLKSLRQTCDVMTGRKPA